MLFPMYTSWLISMKIIFENFHLSFAFMVVMLKVEMMHDQFARLADKNCRKINRNQHVDVGC